MNRLKKEANKKHDDARKGLSENQIISLDLEDAIKEKVSKLASILHAKNFPEEYDSICDSNADVRDRRKGINPMNQEYIEQIRQKREEFGVSPLSSSGFSVSNDTLIFCENEAKKQIYSDITLKRPPAKTCVFCDKSLEQIGGKGLVAQHFRGITLSDKNRGGGNADYPCRSVKLFDDMDVYVSVWGEKTLWTEVTIDKVKNEFLAGYYPWFCQICGFRACQQCGSPIKNPVGSDHIHSDGSITHAPILAGSRGCSNSNCEKYRA